MPPEIDEKELAELKAAREERDALKKAAEEAKNKKTDPDPKDEDEGDDEDDKDLLDKVRNKKQKASNEKDDISKIESAVEFNHGVASFVKENSDLLPEEISDLIEEAQKEKYDKPTQKATALKLAIIKSYFEIQDNVDGLTKGQKKHLDDFEKLTKTGKEDRADYIFENIFEPAFEGRKKVKKAEELNRANSGFYKGNDAEEAYKKRMIQNSRQQFLGEKGEK